jgi:hypothetical protein
MDTAAIQEQVPVEVVEGRRNRRRKYIIDPSFQWRFVLTIAATVFIASTIISSVLYGVLHEQARGRFMDPTGYVADVALVLVGFGLLLSLVAAIGVGVWCILMTHRICGPLHVVGCQLKDLASGRLPKPRKLRTKDEFQAFYQLFSQAVESVRNRQQQAWKMLSELASTAENALDSGDEPRKAALTEIVRQVRNLQESISRTGCLD